MISEQPGMMASQARARSRRLYNRYALYLRSPESISHRPVLCPATALILSTASAEDVRRVALSRLTSEPVTQPVTVRGVHLTS